MKRTFAPALAVVLLALAHACWEGRCFGKSPAEAANEVDLFDAMQSGDIEARFIAKDSKRGRIILQNKTDQPVHVSIPDAFIGVPLAQFGGGMGGMGGGGMGMGGGQQNVGGGGGGRGGGGFGGGRGGGGGFGGGRGGRGGGFNVPPEKIVRVDVPLLCLDHGLREPSESKPYAIRPIENYIKDPAVIAIVAGYANGDLPTGAAQAAVWNLNSEVGWDQLAAKLTGTVRSLRREPYFSRDEIQGAMAIVAQAREMTAYETVEPREFKLPGEDDGEETDPSKIVSPGDEPSPGESQDETPGESAEVEVDAEASAASAPAGNS